MRRAVWPLVTGVLLVGVLFLAVFPTRAWIDQRNERAALEQRVRVLAEQNRRLSDRARQLHSDSEVERLAREQYNLVRPGEEAFAILPPVEPARIRGWWSRTWARLALPTTVPAQ